MKIFNYFTLFIALVISACAAYYSITGLTAIFAGAFWPVIIMGSALEAGKLTGIVWLHTHWNRAQWWIKTYMVPAVAVLMLITSMGIFGFLSRAHIEQTAGSVDVVSNIEQLDVDIKAEQQRIDNNNKLISQLDAAVDNMLGTAATQGQQTSKGNASAAQRATDLATKLRKQQEPQRKALQDEIGSFQDKISELQKQKITFDQQFKKIEAEVGPIKYVAALLYGDNPDKNTLERAVRWMIIILVIVFDPLAMVLILAATSVLTRKEEALVEEKIIETVLPPVVKKKQNKKQKSLPKK